MKIYNKVVIDTSGEIIEEDSFEYEGVVAEFKGGGGGSTTESGPPDWAVPYWKDTLSGLPNLKQEQYYPGEAVAGFTPAQLEAQQGVLGMARAGSPLLGGTNQMYQDTIGGKYLSPESNPWLKGAFDQGVESSLPYFNSQAVSAGRYGGGAQQMGQGKLLADLASNIYGGNYQQERSRQMQAAQLVPSFDEQYRFGDLGKISAVGEDQQGMNQAFMDAAKQKWDFGQVAPYREMMNKAGILSGIQGGTTVQTGGGK